MEENKVKPEINGNGATESALVFEILAAVPTADLRSRHLTASAADQLGWIVLRSVERLQVLQN